MADQSPEIRTERLTTENADLLDRVDDDVFDEPINRDRLTVYLHEPGHLMIVAVADDEVVGMCTAMVPRHADKATELYRRSRRHRAAASAGYRRADDAGDV